MMIIVPVCISAVIAFGCVSAVWQLIEHGAGFGFEDSEDFYRAGAAISTAVQKALESNPDKRFQNLHKLSSLADRSAMSVSITKDGIAYYSYGSSDKEDAALTSAAAALGGNGIVSRGPRSLYARVIRTKDAVYQLCLFSSQCEISYGTLKVAVALAAIIMLFTIFISVLLTNRFLTKFVLQRIERPIDILVDGVRQIRNGNLDYRIEYAGHDEFATVCSDFNEMAARLKYSVEQTKLHEESRRELMAGLSHDLRSPLTSVQAYVEGLLDGVAKTPEMRNKYLQTIKSKAEDIEHMVSQMFLFSKMELDEYPVHPEQVRLDEEINSILSENGAEFSSGGLVPSSTLCAAYVTADRAELRRMLMNIISNSMKYKTKPHVDFNITLKPEGEEYELEMADNGPGVDCDAMPKLFDLFYREDVSRRDPRQGSGLGLAIAAKIVKRMGGRIEACATEGGGLTIRIWLPKSGDHDE